LLRASATAMAPAPHRIAPDMTTNALVIVRMATPTR
jgi:hypothetical protein